MTQFAAIDCNVYSKEYSKESPNFVIHHPKGFQYPLLKNIIMFLHAFCGCDTTSSFCGCGKKEIFQIFHSNPNLVEHTLKFNSANTNIGDLFELARMIIFQLYKNAECKKILRKLDGPIETTSKYRYIYSKSLEKLGLDRLPPMDGALKQHALKVYLQCQSWLENDLNPCNWVWKKMRTF